MNDIKNQKSEEKKNINSTMNVLLSLMKTDRFMPLFLAQFFGAFNDNVYKNAIVMLITYGIFSKSNLDPQILITLAGGIFILPFFLFSATAGQIADKYDKATLIKIIKFTEIIIMIFGVLGFITESLLLLLIVLFFMGAQSAFFGPIKYSILPENLERTELIAGNSLIEFGTFVAILLGTILGGVSIMTEYGIILTSIIVIIISIVGWVASLKIPTSAISDPDSKIDYNPFHNTISIIKKGKRNYVVFLCTLGISWFWLVGATFLAQFPTFAKDIIGGDETIVTLFLTTFSLGIGIGSMLCNKILKSTISATYVPLGILFMSFFLIDIYQESRYMVKADHLINIFEYFQQWNHVEILIDLFLLSVSSGLYIVPLYTIMQDVSNKRFRSRIIAANNIINSLFMVISAVLVAILYFIGADIIDVFLLIAIANCVVAFYICKLLPDELIRSILRAIFKFFFRVEVKGIENYYKAGNRLLIIANHTSFLDGALLVAFLPHKLTFAINTMQAKRWWVKLLGSLVTMFDIDPNHPIKTKTLIKVLRGGEKVAIFPEGRITLTGSLMKIYEGPGMIADKSNAQLVPIRIDGAQYTYFSNLSGKIKLRPFPKITITILEPVNFNIPTELKGRTRRRYAAEALHKIMTEMIFRSSEYEKTLFGSLLEVKSIHGGNHIILEDQKREPISYLGLIIKIFILGRLLATENEYGSYVGIMLPNSIASVVSIFALQIHGMTPAILNFSTGAQNLISACISANISNIYTSRIFVEKANLDKVIQILKNKKINIYFLEDMKDKISILDKLVGLIFATIIPNLYYKYLLRNLEPSKKVSYENLEKICSNKASVVLFTSGSEGYPKGVVLSHANIQANKLQIVSSLDFVPNDIVLNALPVFHSFGLTAGTLMPLLSGIRTFLYPSPLHYRIVPEMVYDISATIFFGTDTFLNGYAKCAHPYDFYSVRYVFAGAEKLKDKTREIWSEKFGCRILEGYGATEASPVISVNTPIHNKSGSVGQLIPGIEYKICKIPGIENGGRLVVRGPNIMLGYLRIDNPGKIYPPYFNFENNIEDLEESILENKWYDTGDIVQIDEKGYLTIHGRLKRFAKIAGEMISLTTVEQYIEKLWPDYMHAIISIPDERKGEQLILVTTYKDSTKKDIITTFKSTGVGEIYIPKEIIILSNIPLLSTGKIDYVSTQKLVDEYLFQNKL